MIINFYKGNGGGGSGSGSTGPQGPQGPQGFAGTDGVQGPQGVEGVQGPAGSGSQGGDSHILKSSSDTPANIEAGDVYAIQNDATTQWIDFEGNAVPAGQKIVRVVVNQDGQYLFHYDNDNTWVGLDLSNGTFTVYGGLTADGENKWTINNGATGYIEYDGTYLIATITDTINYWSMLDAYEIGGQRSYAEVIPGIMGVYQYDGTNSRNIAPIIGLDTISGVTGEVNTLYEYNGRLYKWVNGDGNWGKWVIADYNNQSGAGTINNQMNYLAYSYLPTDGKICALFYVNTYYSLALDRANNVLNYYDNREATGTPVSSITFGSSAHTSGYNNRYIDITWEEGLITFNCGAYTKLYDMISTTQSGGHFEALDVINFKGKNLNNSSAQYLNIPAWNSEGLIYGSALYLDVGSKKLNTTGYGNTVDFLVKNGAGGTKYQSWYIPTQGGTVGQVLTSAGDAEPQWATLIKSVKITSQAYEALQTKDPNTLYLIVDE